LTGFAPILKQEACHWLRWCDKHGEKGMNTRKGLLTPLAKDISILKRCEKKYPTLGDSSSHPVDFGNAGQSRAVMFTLAT
jgi:hypothetical protein